MALTPRQERFVAEYLVDLNATQAAIRAGYSEATAHAQGSRLLKNAEVAEAIREAQAARSARVEVRADEILLELKRIALADLGEAFDDNGNLKPMKDIPPDVRRAMAGVDVIELPGSEDGEAGGLVKKVKFWDKTKALELLGKHLKLYTDKVEVSGALSIQVVNPYAKPGGKR